MGDRELTDCKGDFAVVHNGIIENFMSLKEALLAKGHVFQSETDTEVLAHLLEDVYEGDFEAAVREVLRRVEGSYALVFLSRRDPDWLICSKQDNPLVIGLGQGENLIAAVLGQALFGDIHAGHDFHPGDQPGLGMAERLVHVVENAVHPFADAHPVAAGLDVNVADPFPHRWGYFPFRASFHTTWAATCRLALDLEPTCARFRTCERGEKCAWREYCLQYQFALDLEPEW